LAHSGRHPGSLARSAACGLAAAVLLVPAYALPVMSVANLGHAHADTIFSGVWKLWHGGMWGIALIVFTASLLVPVLKLSGLVLLHAAVHRPGLADVERLEKLHAVIHVIGRWSMLDIFLVAFLCGIVRFGSLATIEARPGAVAFAAAVILTMLATSSFDPGIFRRIQSSSA
jgi:paraquat-inducible protein A